MMWVSAGLFGSVCLEPAGSLDIMFQRTLQTQLSCGFSCSFILFIQETKGKFNAKGQVAVLLVLRQPH
jgi:hypothetical protein